MSPVAALLFKALRSGGLYAVMLLLPEGDQELIRQRFRDQVGHIHCKPIRQENVTKCVDCVRIAADLPTEFSRHESCRN